MKFHYPTAVCLLLTASEVLAGISSWDEMQLQLLRQYSTPVRWDNVEGPPYWVSGSKPQGHWRQARHVISLAPGQETVMRANPNCWLRLAGEGKTLHAGDFEISISTDTRLFAEVPSIGTVDPYSLLVRLPADASCLVRVARPAQASSTVVFAAFLSREEQLPVLAPYRTSIRLPGKPTRLKRETEIGSETAWLLEPRRPLKFALDGPTRVQLVAHTPWPVTEGLAEQPLMLRLQIDAAEPDLFILCPEVDARYRVRLNGSSQLMSRRAVAYFSVPEGKHFLSLETQTAVYVSAFRQPEHEFLIPGLNRPSFAKAPPFAKATEGRPSIAGASSGDGPGLVADSRGGGMSPTLPWTAAEFAATEQFAWRLAVDNSAMESAAQAADWLDRIAQARPDYFPARLSAAKLERERTFYRACLPAQMPGENDDGSTNAEPRAITGLAHFAFAAGHLARLFEPERPLAVINPTLEQVSDLFASGHFCAVPNVLSSPLVYQLPSRAERSKLRVAALGPTGTRARFFVQMDQAIPLRLELEGAPGDPNAMASVSVPKEERLHSQLEPSPGIATLAVLQQQSALTSGGKTWPVGEFDLSLGVCPAGVMELPLSPEVRRVRIYQEAQAPLMVSVSYRAGKPLALGEAQYLEILQQVGVGALATLTPDPAPTGRGEPERALLQNHCLPLTRLLKAHTADFTKSIVLPAFLPAAEDLRLTNSSLSPEACSTLIIEAEALDKEGRALEALELWNRLFWNGTATEREAAALAIMADLQRLGEEFLAAQYARYVLLQARPGALPAAAVALLEQNAREADDLEALEQLKGYLFTRCPCPDHLEALIEALALNSRDEMVLSAGLLLPAERRPVGLLLTAALHAGWWQTFDQLNAALPREEDRALWRAQKQLAFYNFAEAQRYLAEVGGLGRPLLDALGQGIHIRERLADPQLQTRTEAVRDWEQWQATHPGERRWQPARDVSESAPGAELLFNPEQNEFSSYFRAEPGKALRLRFVGPVSLKVEARPLLPAPWDSPLDDWLEIREDGVTNRVPICQCIPNPVLQLREAPTPMLAGMKTAAILNWGPGSHTVDVCLARTTGLFRVLQADPVLPLRVLPTLNSRRLAWVLNPEERGGEAASLPAHQATARPIQNERGVWWVPATAARVDSLQLPPSLSVPRLASPDTRPLPRANSAAPNPDTAARQADYWLATGQMEKLLHSTIPGETELQRLTWLLQVAELMPAWREEAQKLGERLIFGSTNNPPPGARKLMLRLASNRTWLPLPFTPICAGLRPVEVPVDLPQDPSIRIRHALLPPAETNQFTIGTEGVLTLSLNLTAPAELPLRLRLEKAGFSPLAPLTVALQVDGEPIQSLPLSVPQPSREIVLNLGEGPHRIRLWPQDPVVNEFIRVALTGQNPSPLTPLPQAEDPPTELPPSPSGRGAGGEGSRIGLEKRFLYLATPAEPIRFTWKGPALLRVDEWRGGGFLSRYQWVEQGEQKVVIGPVEGLQESWCRVFVRTSQTNAVEPRPTWIAREPNELPPPLRLAQPVAVSEAQLTDRYRLGGQEDGTWTFGLLAARRRPFELSSGQNEVANEFIEAGAGFRKVNPAETLWFNAEGLGRVHRPGDLTFGLQGEVTGRPAELPFEWTWSGAAYVGTTGPEQRDTEGAFYTAAELGQLRQLSRKLDLYPWAGVFAHYLTLDSDRVSQYSYVDQDLYTPYRSDHRWGWFLGSQLAYHPWLDTRLTADADLRSNEDLSPDHWGMQFAWQQLLGPLRAEVAYGFRHGLDGKYNPEFLQGVSAGVYGEYWLNGRHRLELGAQYRHDWPAAGDSYFLVLRWDFSQGRGYRDFAPRSLAFRDLRTCRIPAAFNNLLRLGPPGALMP